MNQAAVGGVPTEVLQSAGVYRRPKQASGRVSFCKTHGSASSLVRAPNGWPRSGGSRFLEVDPVPGGSANDYDYCFQDPVNCTDLGGTDAGLNLVAQYLASLSPVSRRAVESFFAQLNNVISHAVERGHYATSEEASLAIDQTIEAPSLTGITEGGSFVFFRYNPGSTTRGTFVALDPNGNGTVTRGRLSNFLNNAVYITGGSDDVALQGTEVGDLIGSAGVDVLGG
jgi:hypothetical protein